MKKLLNFIYHLFIPHKKNNFRAKTLHLDFLLGLLIFTILLHTIISNFFNTLAVKKNITIQDLLTYTNIARKNNGLPELKLNQKLSLAAEMKAKDMFSKNYWSHYAPDGTTPWEFILKANYEYEYAGENLARGFFFSKDVVDAWMNSPSHRRNILHPKFVDVGFSVKEGILLGEPTTLVVQMFGKPLGETPLDKKETEPKIQGITQNQPQEIKEALAISPKLIEFDYSLIVLSLIALSLILDYLFALRLNIIRNTSHNLISFIFIATLIMAFIIGSKGITL